MCNKLVALFFCKHNRNTWNITTNWFAVCVYLFHGGYIDHCGAERTIIGNGVVG